MLADDTEPETEHDGARLRSINTTMEILEISRSQVYRLGKAGDLDLVKIGTRTRVTQGSIDRYLKSLTPMVPQRK